jgi:hypothetical protein
MWIVRLLGLPAYQETMPHDTSPHLATRRTLFPPLDNFFLGLSNESFRSHRMTRRNRRQ